MTDIKVCCFTGHRRLRHEEKKIAKALDRVVARLVSEGYTRFLSGGAIGFDLLAAEAVIRRKRAFGDVELWLILPYTNNFTSRTREGSRLRTAALEASNVEIISDHASRFAPLARNRRMVELSDACVCYMLCGNESGGTYHTVRLAQDKGIACYNLAEEM